MASAVACRRDDVTNIGGICRYCDSGNSQCLSDVLRSGIGMEKIMTRSSRIGLAAALLLSGITFAMAQYCPLTGGYPPARWNPNFYGHYGYSHYPRYYGHYPVHPTVPGYWRAGLKNLTRG